MEVEHVMKARRVRNSTYIDRDSNDDPQGIRIYDYPVGVLSIMLLS